MFMFFLWEHENLLRIDAQSLINIDKMYKQIQSERQNHFTI